MPALPAARENGPVDRATAIDQLAAVPLDEFVAERKRLAKELRGAGDRDGAAEVAKLPKPTLPAWALNHLAREDPGAAGEWLNAAEALRKASTHAAEVGGDELRAAMAAHREATRRLVAAVRERVPLSEPMLDRVRALLQSATVDPRVAERLRGGGLVEGGDDDDPAPPEPAPEGAKPSARPKRAKQPAPAKPDPDDERRAASARAEKARAELERRAGVASAELERLREEADEREAAAAAADERSEAARRTLRRSESEASAARGAADDARAAVADAERQVRTLIAELRDAS